MYFSGDKLYFNRISMFFLIAFLFISENAVFAQKKHSVIVTNKVTNEKTTKKTSPIVDEERKEVVVSETVRRNAEANRALEERRRREQAVRETETRRRSFESGLRQETVQNISDDNTDGEDLEIRRAAVNALGSHAGTVVVMEAQTGKILTIVNQDWAIRKGFKPCSTIKLVTGIAGINEQLIGSSGEILSRPMSLDLTDALAYSNNVYFQRVGVNFGNEKMISYARTLGLGEPTGINSENEVSGKLPFGNSNPRIYSHGDDFEVTPLQLAVMVSAITNGGKLVVPQIPRSRSEKVSFRGKMRRQISLAPQNFQGVMPGMIGAVNYGTARRSEGSDLNVAGKTGSCIGQGSWLGLFASVAPVVNPKYAVVVVTRGQSERGKYASAIAGKVYRSLANRINENRRDTQYAKTPLELVNPAPKVNAQTSAKVDRSQGEEVDEETEETVNTSTIKKTEPVKTPTVAKQVSTQPTVKNSPVLSPVVINVKRNPEQSNINSPFTRPRVVKTVSSSRIMK